MRPPLEKTLKTEMAAFAVFHLLLCVFILTHSPTVLLYVGHDVAPVLDGAWRMDDGQLPHRDFPSILGHGYLWQQRLFLSLFRYDFLAFSVSSIVTTTLALAVFFSFYFNGRFVEATNRITRIYLFLLLMSLGLGQYHFGIGHTLVTYANLYNRYCFLALLLLFIQFTLLGGAKPNHPGTTVRLVVVAWLLNYLLFVKLTYFAVAMGMLALCLFLSLVAFKIFWRILACWLLGFVLVMVATDVDVLALVSDYRTISAARGSVFLRPSFLRYKLVQHYNIAYVLSLALLLLQLLCQKAPRKLLLLTAFTGACALLLHLTNWGATDMVLLAFVPVLFILFPPYRRLISFKIYLAVGCVFLFKNLHSVYYLGQAKQVAHTELQSPYLSGFYTNFVEVPCGEDYATRVMSGVQLVDKNKRAGDKVMAFAFDNPFPFLTRTPPPKGVPTVWQYATTYSYTVYTPAKTLFADVTLLLVPTCAQSESVEEMTTLYASALRKHFTAIDRNRYWTLYRKTKPL